MLLVDSLTGLLLATIEAIRSFRITGILSLSSLR
jgi:hypothetical protein